ncbi:MAG: hypothetical protein CM1200mP10_16550 [Candidatus Neomarinimicrobiota bacterium]|nr:MAG: hypothetical protein CM1200mP10_16550 [Candidatus Neomarinimicrobiota bacterium]
MKSTYLPNIKLQEMINADVMITEADLWSSYIKQYVNYTIDGIHVTTNSVQDEYPIPRKMNYLRNIPGVLMILNAKKRGI